MQIKQNLLHSLRQASKNEFSQNEIKLPTFLGNINKVVNEQETGRPFFFLNLQETALVRKNNLFLNTLKKKKKRDAQD